MKAPLTTDAANAVFDVLVEHLGADEADRTQFVTKQTQRYIESYPVTGSLIAGGAQFVRGAWKRRGLTGERWEVKKDRGSRRAIKAANERLHYYAQASHVGASLVTMSLTDAQWAMLEAFVEHREGKSPWIDISRFDRRTYRALLSRGLVMDYPWDDLKALGCLTPEGTEQVYAHTRRQRWEQRGQVTPGEGYR